MQIAVLQDIAIGHGEIKQVEQNSPKKDTDMGDVYPGFLLSLLFVRFGYLTFSSLVVGFLDWEPQAY